MTAVGLSSPEVVSAARQAGRSQSLVHYLAIWFQIGLFLVLLYMFNLESRAFLHLGILIFFGWGIHYFLPLRARLPFFVALSLFGVALTFAFHEERWSLHGLTQAGWIIAIVLGLIGLCHLPVRFAVRVGLIAAVGAGLALGRADVIAVPWSSAIWPIVASMVMFRLIVYLYHLSHETKPVGVTQTLAYFFMVPNVCFPLFPVVDFQTFRRSYYDQADRHQIYQTGIEWIFRGVLQLILYRLVYQNFVLEAEDVSSSSDAVQYFLWPFLLYLRVSGTFHIITGILHLFGFNLPETHKLYFLSSSFTDFWRRINIYWKDFIMKVIYYPVFFRCRTLGDTTALVVATLFAFFMTWVLHSYQWFWIRGSALLAWNDALFWAFLGVLVVGNALYEIKRGRRRRLPGHSLTMRDTIAGTLRTVGTFFAITILWSFWSAGSIGEWLSVWALLWEKGMFEPRALAMVALVALAVAVPAVLLARGQADIGFNFQRSTSRIIVSTGLLLLLTIPAVYQPLGPTVREALASLRDSNLNQRDFRRMERGYYEDLLDGGMINAELWDEYRARPNDWGNVRGSELVQSLPSLPLYEMRPSVEGRFVGAVVQTNRWGMRDKDYEKSPPADTFRVAAVGASYVFGHGVEEHESFPTLLEERLNGGAGGALNYEVLNFAVGGYSPLNYLAQIETKVLEFSPDTILIFEHAAQAGNTLHMLTEALQKQALGPYDFLRDIVRRAGIDETTVSITTDRTVLFQKLTPYKEEILVAVYQRIAELGRRNGVRIVWVFLPRSVTWEAYGLPDVETRAARAAGFPVVDLTGVYDGHDLASLWIADWDHHPNALGHRLIAERLQEIIESEGDVVAIPSPRDAGAGPNVPTKVDDK